MVPNHRLHRTQGAGSFGEVTTVSMIWIKCFCSSLPHAPCGGEADRYIAF
jgi:hypothetical protein